MNQDIIKEIRRAYILARALNVQYQYIREYVNADLKKAINEARAKNNFYIQKIDESFNLKNQKQQIQHDEELAFQLLEQIEKLWTIKNYTTLNKKTEDSDFTSLNRRLTTRNSSRIYETKYLDQK